MLELKDIEEMTEVHITTASVYLVIFKRTGKEFDTPYEILFMAGWLQQKSFVWNHSRIARYEILWKIIQETFGKMENETQGKPGKCGVSENWNNTVTCHDRPVSVKM